MVLIATLRPPRSEPPRPRQIELRPLEWETNFFGAKMAALTILPAARRGARTDEADAIAAELRQALREAELDDYRHVSLRLAADDVAAIWAAQRAGLRLMDIGVDLTFRFDRTARPQRGDLVVREGTAGDIPALQAMTLGAFELTRFGVDPFFTRDQVDAFYKTWANNLFYGLADAVFIAEIDGRPAGFVSCKLTGDGVGRIPLVATSTSFQRRGAARDALAAAIQWFADAGCRSAHVKTQAANYAAVALYERAGFTVTHTDLTFTTTLN